MQVVRDTLIIDRNLGKALVDIAVNEGPQYVVGSFEINGARRFSNEDLRRNFDAFVDAIVRAKPSGAKGKYVKKVALTSTMGPGLKVEVEAA
jgi:outer membrane protein assembly factor BamA